MVRPSQSTTTTSTRDAECLSINMDRTSHLALIAAALNLDRQLDGRSGGLAHLRRPLGP